MRIGFFKATNTMGQTVRLHPVHISTRRNPITVYMVYFYTKHNGLLEVCILLTQGAFWMASYIFNPSFLITTGKRDNIASNFSWLRIDLNFEL
jgi:hypothetical protein